MEKGLNRHERKASSRLLAGLLTLAGIVLVAGPVNAEQSKLKAATRPNAPDSAAAIMPVSTVSPTQLSWTNDIRTSLRQASRQNKLVLVDVYTDWCGWCKKLDKDTYSDPSVISFLNSGFVCLKVDAEDGGEGEALA